MTDEQKYQIAYQRWNEAGQEGEPEDYAPRCEHGAPWDCEECQAEEEK